MVYKATFNLPPTNVIPIGLSAPLNGISTGNNNTYHNVKFEPVPAYSDTCKMGTDEFTPIGASTGPYYKLYADLSVATGARTIACIKY